MFRTLRELRAGGKQPERCAAMITTHTGADLCAVRARARHGLFPKGINHEETTMRSKDAAGHSLPGRGNLEHSEPAVHAVQESRRNEHGAEDGGRNRAYQAGRYEARAVLETQRGRRCALLRLGAITRPEFPAGTASTVAICRVPSSVRSPVVAGGRVRVEIHRAANYSHLWEESNASSDGALLSRFLRCIPDGRASTRT